MSKAMKQMKRIEFILLLSLNAILAIGQDIDIKSFEIQAKDNTAATSPRKDLNGTTCGLVKIALNEPGMVFEGNVMGDVEFTGNEYLVYLTAGTKRLGIKHPDYLPTTVVLSDYGTSKIISATTYRLNLKTTKKKKIDNSKKGQAIFNLTPSNALLLIDDQPTDGTGGAYSLTLPYGTHYYTVKYGAFSLNNIQVKIDKEPKNISVDLTEYFASLSVSCLDPEAELFINNEQKGLGKWEGLLVPGNYVVEARKDGHTTLSKSIELQEEGSEIIEFEKLKLIVGSLRVETQPTGSEIFLNGEKVGVTPWINKELPIGEYKLKINSPYYYPMERKITIREDTELRANDDDLTPTQYGKLIMAAQSGNPDAQSILGDYYYEGSTYFLEDMIDYADDSTYLTDFYIVRTIARDEGFKINKDVSKAIYWYEKALSTFENNRNKYDNDKAEGFLNNLIESFIVIYRNMKDYQKSFYYAQKYNMEMWLDIHYSEGYGVEKDETKALYYRNKWAGSFYLDGE